jgi:hypothetical protein
VPLFQNAELLTQRQIFQEEVAARIDKANEQEEQEPQQALHIGLFVRSIRNVVTAMAIEAASVTSIAGTWIRMGETPTRPMSKPRANPSDNIVFCASMTHRTCG